MCACVCVCVYVCMHACMHASMYVYVSRATERRGTDIVLTAAGHIIVNDESHILDVCGSMDTAQHTERERCRANPIRVLGPPASSPAPPRRQLTAFVTAFVTGFGASVWGSWLVTPRQAPAAEPPYDGPLPPSNARVEAHARERRGKKRKHSSTEALLLPFLGCPAWPPAPALMSGARRQHCP